MTSRKLQSRFGGRLRALRNQRGITLEALAREMGVHFTTISSWERGRSEPDFELLERLASRLGVGVGELLDEPSRSRRRVVLRIWSTSRWHQFMSGTEGIQLAQALHAASAPESRVQDLLGRVERSESLGPADVLGLSSAYEVEAHEAAGLEKKQADPPALAERIQNLPAALRPAVGRLIGEWLALVEAGREQSAEEPFVPSLPSTSPPASRGGARRRGRRLRRADE